DLYYRLYVVEIHVPPLRERADMIPGLAQHFLGASNRQYRRQMTLPPDVVALMEAYHWPGNVRELENFVRRFVVLGNPDRAREDLATRVETGRRRAIRSAPTEPVAVPVPPILMATA